MFVQTSILSDTLAKSKTNLKPPHMIYDAKALKTSLLKRELELQRLIRQMKLDQLHGSAVYKNLEKELVVIKHQLKEEVAE